MLSSIFCNCFLELFFLRGSYSVQIRDKPSLKFAWHFGGEMHCCVISRYCWVISHYCCYVTWFPKVGLKPGELVWLLKGPISPSRKTVCSLLSVPVTKGSYSRFGLAWGVILWSKGMMYQIENPDSRHHFLCISGDTLKNRYTLPVMWRTHKLPLRWIILL